MPCFIMYETVIIYNNNNKHNNSIHKIANIHKYIHFSKEKEKTRKIKLIKN